MSLAHVPTFAQNYSSAGTYASGSGSGGPSKYIRINTALSASAAISRAGALAAKLATIGSAGENSFLNNRGACWIGLAISHSGHQQCCCPDPSYTLAWDSEQPVTFTGWVLAEPNNCGGLESRVATNVHGPGGWNDVNPAVAYPSLVEVELGDVRISSPSQPVANLQGRYIALLGTGPAFTNFELRVVDHNGNEAFSFLIPIDENGEWEKVIPTGVLPSAVVCIPSGSLTASDILLVSPNPAGPLAVGRYDLLLRGDVIGARCSQAQVVVYGASFSHVAVFVGGDATGTPMVVEADIPWCTSPSRERAVEAVFQPCENVSIRRFTTSLNAASRGALASTARSLRGRPYHCWEDLLGSVGTAVFCWETAPRPRYCDYALTNLGVEFRRPDHLICSTLVWQAYFQQFGVDLVIGSPPFYGGFLARYPAGFVDAAHAAGALILPDGIMNSPLLFAVQ